MNKETSRLYSDKRNLIEIEFANRTDVEKFVWVEPACISIKLDANTEYKVVSHDKTFRIEFDEKETIVLYTQFSFGFKLFSRDISPTAINNKEWVLDCDLSDIN